MYSPPEIISAILRYQSKPELKKARLVCKAFDDAAVPFLFDEIFVAARYADIEKANLVSSRFGPFVKTLIFCSEHFAPGVSWDIFNFPTTELKCNYISYCKLRDEQEELLNGGEL